MSDPDDLCAPSCRQLWCEVLFVALRDVAAGVDPAWIDSRDFYTVCALANVEPEIAKRAVAMVKPTYVPAKPQSNKRAAKVA